MKKIIKSSILRRISPMIFIVFIIFLGIIKIDMINTKALSPLGNTNENYKLVSNEFGEDFSNFIKDNSFLKIYKESEKDVLVKIGSNDFRINNQSSFIKKIEDIIERIKP
ncbi:hypothetical protein ACUH7Y_04245 [Clostridium beijerinckii]|uniref:Uncharacterized protein n=1 Tax=Clostridium beijerinckii TaxID=1520 RepID=A0A1S8SCH9_CLOBE|nr:MULTISPECIES: hypothetical protein [Clostridium]MBA8936395.1 hypothetical protein [Clostridium beijerinckii]MBN7573832.1 hypothetical protein [Clostridium beijerinckii]MBN7579024.1 hypothetical protein [Clostridium beijerinckii]MBN7583463.1 hypothetical protein [Clostridium beijerinckii]MZK51312.1 hypothetical protein [Clostridium beijerinckii]